VASALVVDEAPAEEALAEFIVINSSSTNGTDCEAALASLLCAGEGVLCRAPRNVAKADRALDRLPELSVLPREFGSLVICEMLD